MILERAINAGWLRAGESPIFPRLTFPSATELPGCVFDENRSARDAVLAELLSCKVKPISNPACLHAPGEKEILISQVDRYNLPLRTVLCSQTGLMRSDPYYPAEFLQQFYGRFYRGLYRGAKHSAEAFFADQVAHSQRIFSRTRELLPSQNGRILDIGCGMGGTLSAFKSEGHQTVGCDWGEDYALRGRQRGFDIRVGGIESVDSSGPFDLIIASHVLEHATDPIGFARSTARLLSGSGVMYIEVPGIFYISQFWGADVLKFLQNAHAWHFTQATLRAVLAHAGLTVERADDSIWCVARRSACAVAPFPNDGPRVLQELRRLEAELQGRAIAA